MIAKFDPGDMPEEVIKWYPFETGRLYILTPILDMPGHSQVKDKETGEVFGNYHDENFVEA